MVQVIRSGPSRSSLISEALAPSLGEGLGNFIGDYYADKSLRGVLNDPMLKNAPMSEKLSRLEAAMRPYGQRGVKMFQSQLGIEQQRQQEQEQKKQESLNKKRSGIFAKALRKEKLTPEEEELLGPENLLAAAKYNQDIEAKQIKKQEQIHEKIVPLKSALSRVEEMERIRKKGNLGFGAGVKSLYGGETAKDKGAYETLGNSLIQYASTIPIRNQREFEKLAGRISDPSITDAEAEGLLSQLKRIIKDSLNEFQENKGIQEGTNDTYNSKQNRPPLSSFQR